MKDDLKKNKQAAGFSLIEVLISSALALATALVITNFMKDSYKRLKSIWVQEEISAVNRILKSTLNDSQKCIKFFTNPSAIDPTKVVGLKQDLINITINNTQYLPSATPVSSAMISKNLQITALNFTKKRDSLTPLTSIFSVINNGVTTNLYPIVGVIEINATNIAAQKGNAFGSSLVGDVKFSYPITLTLKQVNGVGPWVLKSCTSEVPTTDMGWGNKNDATYCQPGTAATGGGTQVPVNTPITCPPGLYVVSHAVTGTTLSITCCKVSK